MSARKPKRLRIGHLEVALLPGESPARVEQITQEVRERWQPRDIVEEFDCDTLIHAKFKVERYERFLDHLVACGIRKADIESAKVSYLATIRATERTLEIAAEGLRRKPPTRVEQPSRVPDEEFAYLPVQGRVQ